MKDTAFFDKEIASLWPHPVKDGITNAEKYEAASVKILWILKEPHKESPDHEWNNREVLFDLAEFLKWKASYAKVFEASYGILQGVDDFNEVPDPDELGYYGTVNPAEQIAVININKGGGGATADAAHLRAEYMRVKDLLHRQIEYFDPDVIINANHVVELLAELAKGAKFIDVGGCKYCRVGKRLVVDAQHPNSRGSSSEYFGSILRAYRSQ